MDGWILSLVLIRPNERGREPREQRTDWSTDLELELDPGAMNDDGGAR